MKYFSSELNHNHIKLTYHIHLNKNGSLYANDS